MRRGWWIGILGFLGSIAAVSAGAATLADGGRIVLQGEGDGVVRYVAEGHQLPGGRYEGVCPEACEVEWPLEGVRITLTATPLYESRFGRWGGLCSPAGANRTCTFTGNAGMNVVEARFDPPKDTRVRVPMRGTTTLRLAPSFVAKLRRQGWKLQAIAPGRLNGRTLTLPIAPSGPLTRSARRTSALMVGKVDGRCYAEHDVSYAVHHAGGIRFSRPGGRLNVLPLDKPVLVSIRGLRGLAFRDARRREAGIGFLVETFGDQEQNSGFVKAGTLRLGGHNTRLWHSSWDGLVEDSAKPAITSGPFAAVQLNLRVPAAAC